MSTIFISHVEEDKDVAFELARGLEASGYRTWLYERDGIAGAPYLQVVLEAVSESSAMIVLLSPECLGSEQVDREIFMAFPAKPLMPVLHGLTHEAFRKRRSAWAAAFGAATSVAIPPDGCAAIIAPIVRGLKYLKVEPSGAPPEPEPEAAPEAANEIAPGAEPGSPAGGEPRPQPSGTGGERPVRLALGWLPRRWGWPAAAGLLLLVGLGFALYGRGHLGPRDDSIASGPGPAQPRDAVQAPATEPTSGQARVGEDRGDAPNPTDGEAPKAKGRGSWAPRAGKRAGEETKGPDGGTYVWVPPGEFMMGSDDGEENEKPAHSIRITKGFWLGKCEVTNAQYRRFCTEPKREFPAESDQGDDHPVTYVSWDDAKGYCDRYGLRLPTEAEWEYAARGSESRVYPWGDDWDPLRLCWAENQGRGGSTFPVGSFAEGRSWCGAVDMAGNVWEWCADWYGETYYRKPPASDPPGPATGTDRVVRGGSWSNSFVDRFYCVNRGFYRPADRANDRGFRCAGPP